MAIYNWKKTGYFFINIILHFIDSNIFMDDIINHGKTTMISLTIMCSDLFLCCIDIKHPIKDKL